MTFPCYSTCQQKAFSVTYSADMSRFSLSDTVDGYQTAVCLLGLICSFKNHRITEMMFW